jgi:hypothetical protein
MKDADTVRVDITLRRALATIVAEEKQQVLHIVSVCEMKRFLPPCVI